MRPWQGIIGKNFTPKNSETYLKTLAFDDWQPRFMVLHNTGDPDLDQRPNGYTSEQILALATITKTIWAGALGRTWW